MRHDSVWQHYLMMAAGAISVPLLLSSYLCVEVGLVADELVKAELIGTVFLVAGIITFLQSTFGTRYKSVALQYRMYMYV